MTDLAEGEDRPTMHLRFIDGALHQLWEVGYCDESARLIRVSTKTEWRRVSSTVSPSPQEIASE